MSEALTIDTADVKERYGLTTHTVINWIKTGLKANGERVKLDAVRVGGRWKTSEAALSRFFGQLRGVNG
jgi:hypothetical protein